MDIAHRLTALEIQNAEMLAGIWRLEKLAHRQNEFLVVLASHFLTLIKDVKAMSTTTDALAAAQVRNDASFASLEAKIAAIPAPGTPDPAMVEDAAALPGAVAFINANSDKMDGLAVPGPTL